jgi:hypothetical protein
LSYGARNISDLARMALHQVVGDSPAPEAGLLTKLHELDHRVTAVEGHLALLRQREKVTS